MQLPYVISSKQRWCRIYCRYTFSPLFSELYRQFRREENISQVWNLIMHETISSSQISAMEVNLQQPQAGMDWHTNPERCFWTPVLGFCSLASVRVRCLILVKISSSSICSFTRLAPFRSLALWHSLGWFTRQGTLNGYFMCEPCLQSEWEAVPGLCKWKIWKEKNPHISAWHSSSPRLSELLFTPSPAWEEMNEWLVCLLSLECASPRGL